MKLLRRPISPSDQIPDRFYVISMEFLSLSQRCSSVWNVPSGEERGETDVFAGYVRTFYLKSGHCGEVIIGGGLTVPYRKLIQIFVQTLWQVEFWHANCSSFGNICSKPWRVTIIFPYFCRSWVFQWNTVILVERQLSLRQVK